MLGGTQVYRSAIQSSYFHRLYLSRIQKTFDCDSYFPSDIDLNGKCFKRLTTEQINDNRVPVGIVTDKSTGVQFEVCVFEKVKN